MAAVWLRTLLAPPASLSEGLFDLEQHVVRSPPRLASTAPRVHVDASPWGGGGALQDPSGQFTELFEMAWSQPLNSWA